MEVEGRWRVSEHPVMSIEQHPGDRFARGCVWWIYGVLGRITNGVLCVALHCVLFCLMVQFVSISGCCDHGLIVEHLIYQSWGDTGRGGGYEDVEEIYFAFRGRGEREIGRGADD